MQINKFILKKQFFLLWVALGYLILALFFTYPLITNLSDKLIGSAPGDGFVYIWNIYIFWHQILLGNTPFFTTDIFYPLGANLVLHTYAPIVSLLAIFFLDNLVLYINLLILISFILCGIFTFLLLRLLTKNLPVSFLGGAIYAFCPIMFSYALSQHYYYLFAAFYLPIALLTIFKYLLESRKKYLFLFLIFFWLCFFY